MLVLQHHDKVFIICFPDEFESPGLQGFGDPLHIGGGQLWAESLFQDILRIGDPAFRQHLLRYAEAVKIVDNRLHLIGREAVQLRHFEG